MTAAETRLPLLLLFAAAFAVAALAGGMWVGGAFDLGRTDTALAIPALLGCALIYGAAAGRWARAGALATTGAALAALAMALSLWDSETFVQPLCLLVGAIAALGLTMFYFRATAGWRWPLRPAVGVMLALLWWLGSHVALGHAYTPSAAAMPGRTIVVTGLPLVRWLPPGQGIAPQQDPALTMLRAMAARPVVMTDALASGMLTPRDRLLLAHPRALSPATLVEIDRFVRAGGRAVVLADGLSGWPPPFGFGDPRNPPVTSLLTPLLDHWGFLLAAPVPGHPETGQLAVKHQGYRLTLHSAGRFDAVPRDCQRAARADDSLPVIATCRIGRGDVVLIGDADLLYAPLWQSAPTWARHLRPADNIEWVAAQLAGSDVRGTWGLRPTWRE